MDEDVNVDEIVANPEAQDPFEFMQGLNREYQNKILDIAAAPWTGKAPLTDATPPDWTATNEVQEQYRQNFQSLMEADRQAAANTLPKQIGEGLTSLVTAPGGGAAAAELVSAVTGGKGPVGDAEAALSLKGNTKLNMFHNIPSYRSQQSIVDWLTGKNPTLSNPSIGIAKDNIFGFDEGVTLIPNPASHIWDPRTNQANRLYNRDAYVDRSRSIPGKEVRLGDKEVRLTEGSIPNPDFYQSLLDSPSFKSFADFERSPRGEGLLTDGESSRIQANEYYMSTEQLRGHINNKFSPIADTSMLMQKQRLFPVDSADLDPDLLQYMMRTAMAPSNYAELKVAGQVPVNNRHFSAILVPWDVLKHRYALDDNAIRAIEDATGVPVVTSNNVTDKVSARALPEIDRIKDYYMNGLIRSDELYNKYATELNLDRLLEAAGQYQP